MANKRLYFLPGRAERLDDGLGRVIMKVGYAIHGRELVSDFARLRFAEQLSGIRHDLDSGFWDPDANLIARSYGAYLLLNTLAEMSPFPGRILLLSPVLLAAVANNGFYGSLPPRAEKLIIMSESNGFPAPRYMEIHTGAEDNGCDPRLAARFAPAVETTKLNVVPGAGHELREDYVQSALREFLYVSCIRRRSSEH